MRRGPWSCCPPRRAVRGRLQHRLFLWFGLSILLSGLAVGAAMHALGGDTTWRNEVERVRRFTGGLLAAAWDRPAERDALAASAARELELHVAVLDSAGRPLSTFGPPCRRPPRWRIPVVKEGRVLGTLVWCGDRLVVNPLRAALAIVLACGVLWLASGWIARRLARPHVTLARVAEEIGAGHLSCRAELDCREHGEAGALADAINEMAARIERQMADQRELLAVVSHELRAPLQRMRVLIELLRDLSSGSGSQERLTQLEREVLEIDGLVGELLAGARLDFTALATRPLDAAQVAREALERAGIDPGLLAVEADLRGEGDPTLVARALSNLIDNARKHAGGLTGLRVRAAEGQMVAFEAEDRGAGLPPGAEERAFEPFRRLEGDGAAGGGVEGERRPESLGLGLALVKRIAEAHGGRVLAANRPDGGARVGFTLRRLDH